MSFERDFSILSDIADTVTTVGRKLAINIDRRVVNETPRDTGSAKASWLVSVNQPDNRIVDEDGADVGTAALQAIELGASKAQLFVSGDTLYIQNNQPYINRLNEGWSLQQSSPGYIDRIIAEEVNKTQ